MLKKVQDTMMENIWLDKKNQILSYVCDKDLKDKNKVWDI